MSKPVKNINQTPTESNLKSTLLLLLHKKSVANITVKELCEHAQIYRSTFYSHYPSPEALYEKIQEEEIQRFLRFTEIIDAKTFCDVKKSTLLFLSYIQEHDYVLRTLLFYDHQGRVYQSFTKSLEQQLRDITKSFCCNLSKEYSPIFMSHGIMNAIMHWMETNYKAPKEEIADLLIHTLFSMHYIDIKASRPTGLTG